ncbi:16S rRNA (cytidine(1402)-2'-O)-methyltransferase [Nakamurella sp. YIM 132087]|uniref:Ribosomal RNA small subunit methyltransferase I n=1 Tax=Nakamurella alba TaxID=2665158 RepID=A0A7K1FIG6_9ACTN|nr:16S rRNA (cytidine(1402)-2'-O)-methyltransferase [Nakamurella alba]MTD12684.1 16S rRNA (cytidine(1402)-2'-O)-methyltransferase [Nakamurella alba]
MDPAAVPATVPAADAPFPGAGVLVLAGTPLGRVSDASPGLAAVLTAADVIAAEDTRRFHRLVTDLGVTVRGSVVSYYEAVEQSRIPALIGQLQQGLTVVLVTDAGMPSVSDPGYRLVAAAAAAGVRVTSVPGPSAVLTALALSGLPSDRFTFEGFPPRKPGARRSALLELAGERRTMVFFESVHRLDETLAAMVDVFGADRPAALCRELTKTYEEVRRGTLGEITAGAGDVRGEVTLVIAGASGAVDQEVTDEQLAAEVAELVGGGASRKDAVGEIAARRGLPRRRVYDAAHR